MRREGEREETSLDHLGSSLEHFLGPLGLLFGVMLGQSWDRVEYCMILCYSIYYIVFNHTVLYYIISCYLMLYYIILYNILLYIMEVRGA